MIYTIPIDNLTIEIKLKDTWKEEQTVKFDNAPLHAKPRSAYNVHHYLRLTVKEYINTK